MTLHEMPVKWDAIQFLPGESVWMIPRSTYQGYEIVVGGESSRPDSLLLEFAKQVIESREQWISLSRSFLWEFIERSKFPPENEDWYADAFRFESPGIFTIEFSHVADPYGLWTVELHRSRLSGKDSDSYAVREFRRRNH